MKRIKQDFVINRSFFRIMDKINPDIRQIYLGYSYYNRITKETVISYILSMDIDIDKTIKNRLFFDMRGDYIALFL